MFSYQFLWYLIQIANYQSFSIAAEQLHISQPSLSLAIKKLEEQLDLQLVNREYHRTTLTKDGEMVVELASKAFAYFAQIEGIAASKKQNEKAVSLDGIVIYVNPALSDLLGLALMNIVSKSIQFSNLTADMDVQQLLTDETNTVILSIMSENAFSSSKIGVTVLQKSKSYIMCSNDFPYFSPEQTSVTFKELCNVPIITTKNSLEFHEILFEKLKLAGKPNIKANVSDISALSIFVNNGMGFSFATKLGFNKSRDYSNMRYIPIHNAPNFVMALLYNPLLEENKVALLANKLQEKLDF